MCVVLAFKITISYLFQQDEYYYYWDVYVHGNSSSTTNLGFLKIGTVYPKKYAHGFCFAVLCCGYTLTDFPISIRLPTLALWQSNDCPSASKATLMNMDKYFMWIHYERLHNHNKAKHNKTVCTFLGIYCKFCMKLMFHPQDIWNIWLNTSTSHCLISNLYFQLGYYIWEFPGLHLIVLALLGAMNLTLASCT